LSAAAAVAIILGSTSLPAFTIFNASGLLLNVVSALATIVANAGRFACNPAFLILDAKALASAFGIEEVSSACATHSFSEAAAEPGRQMSAPDIGTTEFAGLNFFSSAAYLSAPTALVAAPPNVSSALPDPPNVTQLAGLTPENTACFNTPLYSSTLESGIASRPSTAFTATLAASSGLTFLSTSSRNLSASGDTSLMELKTG